VVQTFACTAPDQITVQGTYKPKGEQWGESFELVLDGTKDKAGTFRLWAKAQQYTFTRDGIVDVTCPPVP